MSPTDSSPKTKAPDVTVAKAILTLAICHNVTPIYGEDGEWDLQAASPDEIALVKTAADGNFINTKTQQILHFSVILHEILLLNLCFVFCSWCEVDAAY